MPMTNYPQGFANGLSLRGMPLLQTQPGNTFWVDNNPSLSSDPNRSIAGSDSNRGTFQRPFSSIAGALAMCTQGNGDIIFVKPGHVEYVNGAGTKTNQGVDAGTAFTFNCAGAAIIGLGTGWMRPRIEFNTAATANIPVRSAFMSLQNFVLKANFADVASMFTSVAASVTASIAGQVMTVTAVGSGTLYPGANLMGTGVVPGTVILYQISGTTGGVGVYQVSISQTVASTTVTSGTWDFDIEGCDIYDTSSVLNALTVYTGAATVANNADGFRFAGNRISSLGTTAATTAIKAGVGCDRWSLVDNFGNWAALNAAATLLAGGAFNLTNLDIGRNRVNRASTAQSVGLLMSSSSTACTGHVYDNYVWSLTATPLIVSTGTKLAFSQNFVNNTGAADKSGLLLPANA